MDHGGSRVQHLSGAYWGVLAGMEELIGTRDPSDFDKVMLAHLQNCINNRKVAAYKKKLVSKKQCYSFNHLPLLYIET